MNYSSRLGSIFYEDSVISRTGICDPTLLFLLGLESIISQEQSNEYIVIPKYIYNKDNEQIVFSDYSVVKSYLSKVGEVAEYDHYFKYKCNGLKYFANELTGTDKDRISPLIFHDSSDASQIDLLKPTYRIPSDVYDSMSYNDKLSQKIHDIFEDAGYNLKCRNLDFVDGDDNYNNTIKLIHAERISNSNLYKLLDYKSMYSYALGVLYGCKNLGYDGAFLWVADPSSWYNGEYKNLVNTAFNIFRFHFSRSIPSIDNNKSLLQKYKGIQQNKIWNYDEEGDYHRQDEVLCDSVKVLNNHIITQSLLYSQSTGPSNPFPGSYLIIGNAEWLPLDNTVISDNPKTGIIKHDDSGVVRYIANDEVIIKKAYKIDNDRYLSPNYYDKYFVYTGNLGWVNFSEDSYKELSDNNRVLTLSKTSFNEIPNNCIKLARLQSSTVIVPFYKCYVSDGIGDNRISLYGILDSSYIRNGIIDVDSDAAFTEIISEDLFNSRYDYPINISGYTLTTLYDVSTPVNVYVCDSDSSKMWDGSDIPVPISEFGYTETPSILLDTYIDSDGNSPISFNLRYNEDYDYWSNEWVPREWKQLIDDDIYLKLTDTTSLYRNTENIINNLSTYTLLNDSSHQYIFNNNQSYYFEDLSNGFIPILGDTDSAYSIGITTYICNIVYTDDYGNSLLDDNGRPLVWYDSVNQMYWNGLFNINQWQNEKPAKFSKYMYNSETNEWTHVYDNEIEEKICINGTFISYSEFYSHPNYGLVRNRLLVFNNSISDNPIECYNDTYSSEYCIPNITDVWVSRETISSLGYTFVDGISDLYMGNDVLSLIFDSDPID